MIDTKQRKKDRMKTHARHYMNTRAYNLVMGLSVIYGLVVNMILTSTAYDLVSNINPTVFIIGYFISALAGTIISHKSSNPFISFIGYNMICVPIGLLLSISLKGIDTSLIVTAIGLTAAVTIIMTIAAVMFPNFFSKLGPALFITLIALLVVEIIAIFTGMSTGWIDTICVVLFSLYIGYDYHVAQQYPKTLDNAIDSSIDIYLDVINLFLRILSLLAKDD